MPGGGSPINRHFEALGFTVVFRDDDPPIVSGTQDLNDDENEALISLEVDIENALVANLGQLETGLQLHNEGDKTGQQYQINFDEKKKGRIDILAVDSRGDFVVIEIRPTKQIAMYVGRFRGTWAGLAIT